MGYSADLAYIVDIARQAGRLARRGFGTIDREMKTSAGERILGWDPVEAVTESDRACQRLIIQALRTRFPDDGIIGEENDDAPGITHRAPRAGCRTWVIDPIDGTNNYVAGLGCYAVCIGLLDQGMPILGVVYDVARDCVAAAADGVAYCDERPVRACTSPLSDRSLVMLTSNLLDRRGSLPGFITIWLERANWKLRILGSSALEAAQVGVGVAHAAITVNGKLWDIAAAAAVVLASGGRVVDFTGRDVFPLDVTRYQGAKVPFLAVAPEAIETMVDHLTRHGWPVDSN